MDWRVWNYIRFFRNIWFFSEIYAFHIHLCVESHRLCLRAFIFGPAIFHVVPGRLLRRPFWDDTIKLSFFPNVWPIHCYSRFLIKTSMDIWRVHRRSFSFGIVWGQSTPRLTRQTALMVKSASTYYDVSLYHPREMVLPLICPHLELLFRDAIYGGKITPISAVPTSLINTMINTAP